MEEDAQIDLRRNVLAKHFGAARRRDHYVWQPLVVDHGYIIDSRAAAGVMCASSG
jgi:transcriptional regulator CtsR